MSIICSVPLSNFSDCNPQVKMGEIQKIYVASLLIAPFIDWTSVSEWETRLESGDITELTVSAEMPLPDFDTVEISGGRVITTPSLLRIDFTIDDNSNENYEFMRWTAFNTGVRVWYATQENIYGGKYGIKANISAKEIIPIETNGLINLEGFISWKSKTLPVRHFNFLGDADFYNTGEDSIDDADTGGIDTGGDNGGDTGGGDIDDCGLLIIPTITSEVFYLNDKEYVGYLKDVAGSISEHDFMCGNEITGFYSETESTSQFGNYTFITLKNAISGLPHGEQYPLTLMEAHWERDGRGYYAAFQKTSFNETSSVFRAYIEVLPNGADDNRYMVRWLTSSERWDGQFPVDYYPFIPSTLVWENGDALTINIGDGQKIGTTESYYGYADVDGYQSFGSISAHEIAPNTTIKALLVRKGVSAGKSVRMIINADSDLFLHSKYHKITWVDGLVERHCVVERTSVGGNIAEEVLSWTIGRMPYDETEPAPLFGEHNTGTSFGVSVDYQRPQLLWQETSKDVTVGQLTIDGETFYGFADGLPVGDGGTYGAISSTDFAPTTQIKGIIINEDNNKMFLYLNDNNTWPDQALRARWTDDVRERFVSLFRDSVSVASQTTPTYLGSNINDTVPSIPPFRLETLGTTVTINVDFFAHVYQV